MSRRRLTSRLCCASSATVLALAVPMAAFAQVEEPAAAPEAVVQDAQPTVATTEAATRPNINPYDRDIAMTVPLNFNRRVLGELDVLLTRDDYFIVYSRGFIDLISPLLTPEGQAELEQLLADRPSFTPEEIANSGIVLDYDPTQLAVMVLRIEPSKRAVEGLFQQGRSEEPGAPPEPFSAYLNTNLVVSKFHGEDDMRAPSVFMMGAMRYKNVVFEADFQGQEQFAGADYEVSRRYARFVYDDPKNYRRWWLGDLDTEMRGRQNFLQMGGIGIARQRQRFDNFRNSVLSGNRQIVLQEGSTVRVSRNGIFMREFQLDAGQYDLSNLPLEIGSNDIQLEIRDVTGRSQTLNYSAYLDAIDLDPGDYEYGAFLGVTSPLSFGSPDYSDGELTFSGYWRKAFENRPAIGLGLQADRYTQSLSGQTQLILPNGSRLRFDGALTTADGVGTGYTLATMYDHFIDRGLTYDTWAVGVEYISEDFTTVGNRYAQNQTEWAFQGSYSRRFNERWIGSLSGSYRVSRDSIIGNSYSVNLHTNYSVTKNWGVQAGVEYSDIGMPTASRMEGFGFTLALVWTPRYDRRAEARYNSARNSASLTLQQSGENRVGALGYSLSAGYDDGPSNLSGQVTYTGNRFDGAIVHSTFGENFSDVTDQHVTTLTAGSAIAFTGGKFAIGRRIYDSFAIVGAHKSLEGRSTIVGDNLEGGRYNARSGALGPALSNQLGSYVNQSIRYDVIDVPAGYDIGDGIKRVHPSYRSGYYIEAGSDAFVSAVGRLVGFNDQPAGLFSGRIYSVNEPDMAPEVFFTNSVGRFAIQKLKPGHSYRVELFSNPARHFEFTVPEDNEGLLDLQKVSLPIFVTEQ